MSNELKRAEDLFDLNRVRRLRDAEPAEKPAQPPPPEPKKPRGRLVRNRVAVRAATQPEQDLTAQAAVALADQATALKRKLLAAREQLGQKEPRTPTLTRPQPTPRVAPPATPLRPPHRTAARAKAPAPPPAEPVRQWRLQVVVLGDAAQPFFLAASDMVEATRKGAREIARWMRENRPGATWRVDAVELLADVL